MHLTPLTAELLDFSVHNSVVCEVLLAQHAEGDSVSGTLGMSVDPVLPTNKKPSNIRGFGLRKFREAVQKLSSRGGLECFFFVSCHSYRRAFFPQFFDIYLFVSRNFSIVHIFLVFFFQILEFYRT